VIEVLLNSTDGPVKSGFRVHSTIGLDRDDNKVVQRVRQFVSSISDSLVLQKLPKWAIIMKKCC
jgi:hypothetical protein